MKIAVCIKQVPDTESRLRINSDGTWIVEEDLPFTINESDECALEEALQIAADHEADVVVFSLGPARVSEALRKALALGADRAVHLDDEAFLKRLPFLLREVPLSPVPNALGGRAKLVEVRVLARKEHGDCIPRSSIQVKDLHVCRIRLGVCQDEADGGWRLSGTCDNDVAHNRGGIARATPIIVGKLRDAQHHPGDSRAAARSEQ